MEVSNGALPARFLGGKVNERLGTAGQRPASGHSQDSIDFSAAEGI
jgi:hypothetical protein